MLGCLSSVGVRWECGGVRREEGRHRGDEGGED